MPTHQNTSGAFAQPSRTKTGNLGKHGKYCNKVTIGNLITVVTMANQNNEARNGYFNSQGIRVDSIK